MKNTKVKVYNITWNWDIDPYDEPSETQVTLGACPFELWGDDTDKWTEEQVGFDQSIWHFFNDEEDFQSYVGKKEDGGDWHIIDYEFSHEEDLAEIK
jgi:hypothetical protein